MFVILKNNKYVIIFIKLVAFDSFSMYLHELKYLYEIIHTNSHL